jgi:hypothetical protein
MNNELLFINLIPPISGIRADEFQLPVLPGLDIVGKLKAACKHPYKHQQSEEK